MSREIVNSTPFPFQFNDPFPGGAPPTAASNGVAGATETLKLPNVRGRIPSIQASRLRTMVLEAHDDPTKILAHCCSYDGLSSRLVEEAGFPIVFLAGFAVASSFGLPDTGYIAMEDMCGKIQEVVRQVSVPVFVDGDTGYGSPMNVRRSVESFAQAGAAGVMIEDQTWPKRCGHTKGKSVVGRGEAFARIQAAVDARNEGLDIVILARTDALIISEEEGLYRAKKFFEIGADIVFVEALRDRAAMERALKAVNAPLSANIVEDGKTEQMSATDLAAMGFCTVAYPWTLVAAKLKSIREALENLKASMTKGGPPKILSYDEITYGVGFHKYWELEKRYEYEVEQASKRV